MTTLPNPRGITNNAGLARYPREERRWLAFLQELERHYDTNVTSKLPRAVTKIKKATQSLASDTAVANDDELAGWTVESNKRYSFEAYIWVFQNVGNFQYKFAFDNAVANSHLIQRAIDQTATPNIDDDFLLDAISVAQPITTMADGQQYGLHLAGTFLSHATLSATMDFQWAQETSSANNTNVVANSWIRLEQLGSQT